MATHELVASIKMFFRSIRLLFFFHVFLWMTLETQQLVTAFPPTFVWLEWANIFQIFLTTDECKISPKCSYLPYCSLLAWISKRKWKCFWQVVLYIQWKEASQLLPVGVKRWRIFCIACLSDNLSYFHMISIKVLNTDWKPIIFYGKE